MPKITKENAIKFIEEARQATDTSVKAKDTRDYEVMLVEMLREEFKGM